MEQKHQVFFEHFSSVSHGCYLRTKACSGLIKKTFQIHFFYYDNLLFSFILSCYLLRSCCSFRIK